jgi:hypothetical protein
MNFKRKPIWRIIIPIISMILLLLADVLHMTRIDVVAACYRMGRKSSPGNSTGFGAGSLGALRLLMDEEDLYMFSRSFSDSLQIREKIKDYLDYIFCSSGIFNPGACESWRESIAVSDQ